MRLALGFGALGLCGALGWACVVPTQNASDAAVARHKAASEVMELAELQRQRGDYDISSHEEESRFRWSLRLAESAIAAGVQTKQQAYADHVARMAEIEAAVRTGASMGRKSSMDCAVAAYFAADARITAETAAGK